jgi:hypothetical protein
VQHVPYDTYQTSGRASGDRGMSTYSFPICFDENPRKDKVALAVVPFDGFSGRAVSAGVNARIQGLYNRPIKNLSRHLVFINLPQQPQYVVQAHASEAGYQSPPNSVFIPPAANDSSAAKRRHLISLVPPPDFTFAEATTVIRGVVQRGDYNNAKPAKGARIPVNDLSHPLDPGFASFVKNPQFETRSDDGDACALPIRLPHSEDPKHEIVEVTSNFMQGDDSRELTKKVRDGRSQSFVEPIDLIGSNDPEFFDPYQA